MDMLKYSLTFCNVKGEMGQGNITLRLCFPAPSHLSHYKRSENILTYPSNVPRAASEPFKLQVLQDFFMLQIR